MIIAPEKAPSGRRSGLASREQLLAVAAMLFARKGLHRVTLAEIAGEAGMSGPAIYNHFESKNALFSEVVCLMYEEEIAAFSEVLDPLDSVCEALDQLMERVPHMYRDDGVLQLLGLTAQLEAVRDPELFMAISDAARRRDEVAIRLVERAKRQGELPADADANELGSMMISLFVGALGNRALRASRHGQFVRSVEALRSLLRMMRSGPAAEQKNPEGVAAEGGVSVV
ncbi:TetR/AcrR family transcriptional regulator [Noviherbaspirillum sedimenti]|uniref:TetR/AcrR family transcriptional regulator n=1 Tax=Noviherbaspirillum sedimenti TaxID=2320865 RepID=A0A3A3G9D9_9BURK|nr:TetR/AcrR family transcriptional regulator [Noviherbaspirillum sedimenti]RJG03369.1 TetR/AcrR family transcriptional regulator [Noviherbaspirillum sedimenti]